MWETVELQLSEEISAFIRQEKAARGLNSTKDFIHQLLADAHAHSLRKQLDHLIQEGLDSPMRELSPADWDRFRAIAAGEVE